VIGFFLAPMNDEPLVSRIICTSIRQRMRYLVLSGEAYPVQCLFPPDFPENNKAPAPDREL